MAKRWCDTTHTFHIADREMIVTPYNFHHMTDLRCDGALINLKSESGVQLGIDFLKRWYSSDTFHYFDIEPDYRVLPKETLRDCAKMARAFLLYILGTYLFTNREQMVSLRWLALFRDFGEAREAY